MAVFRVERNSGYTVMSNHHLRNKELTLKAKGLLSQMLSLPEDWDYTLAGLSHINRESIDAIRTAVWELEKAGYILRRQGRDEKGKMTAIECHCRRKGLEALHAAECGVQRRRRSAKQRLHRLVLCDAGGGRKNLHPFGNRLESRYCIRQRKPDTHAGELLRSRSAERK